ncbi:MAG: AI-2E family transporter [Cyclobacteriaceae bacterium]
MRRLFVIIFVFVCLLGMAVWYFSNIFIYITFSIVLATVLRPLTNQISKFQVLGGQVPRSIAIIISFSTVIGVVAIFVILFIPLINKQIEIISDLDFNNVLEVVLQPVRSFELFLLKKNLTDNQSGFLVDGLKTGMFDVVKDVNFTKIINSLISFTGSFFIGFLAISFITFFLLLENGIIRRLIISIVPNKYFEVFISGIYKIEKLLSNYLLGLLFQMISIFAVASIGLSIVGVKYALTIAVFAAVANLIPYLGPILGASFGILVTISTTGGLEANQFLIVVVKVLSVFAFVQVVDNVFLQPLIFSKSVKAHPLEIFVIIFVGATVAGISGMIAAIPVYTIVRVSSTEIYTGFNEYKVFKSKN